MSNASPALHSSSWSSSTAGLLTRDHHLTVPLDRRGPGDAATDHAREAERLGEVALVREDLTTDELFAIQIDIDLVGAIE